MISVANLLRQLSGNKFLFIVLSGVLLLMSCGTPRTVTDPSPPPLPVEEDKKVSIDTVHMEVISLDDKPPFIYPEDSPFRERLSEGLPAPEILSSYNILLVLPMEDWPAGFELEDLFEEIEELIEEEDEPEEEIRLDDYLNEEMIGFLNGFEFGLRTMTEVPFQIVLEVVAGGDDQPAELEKALQNVKFDPHVIVGGSSRSELELLSAFSEKKEAVLVNPWFAGQFNPQGGGNMVSFQPDLLAHFESVLYRLNEMEDEDEFYVIYSPRENNRVDQFKELFFDRFPDRTFGDIFFQADEDILEFDFEEYFSEESKVWFFIPMTRNHPFIHPILRAIDLTRTTPYYEVIGLTLWDRDIHLEFHQKLNLVNTSPQLPVGGNRDYRAFHLQFFEKMNYIGGINEYLGNITANFIGSNLIAYGHRFPFYLPFSQMQAGHFYWQFADQQADAPAAVFGSIPANLRNRGIFLLTFKEGRFKTLNTQEVTD